MFTVGPQCTDGNRRPNNSNRSIESNSKNAGVLRSTQFYVQPTFRLYAVQQLEQRLFAQRRFLLLTISNRKLSCFGMPDVIATNLEAETSLQNMTEVKSGH